MNFPKKLSILFSGLLALSSFSLLSKPAELSAASSSLSVWDVQLRGDASGFYFVITSSTYSVAQTTVIDSANSSDHITLYLNDEDVGVKLSSLMSSSTLDVNKWVSQGLMYPISSSNVDKYNGASVKRITIDKDTVFPTVGGTVTIDSELTCLNPHYGDHNHKYEAFDWEISRKSYVSGIQLRGDEGGAYLVVVDPTFLSLPVDTIINDTTKFNAPEYIRLHLDEDDEGILLSSIISSSPWKSNMWQSSGAMFPIAFENYEKYNGTTVYSVDILEGCELPYNDATKAIVKQNASYINLGYGDENKKFSSFYSIEKSRTDIELFSAQMRGDVGEGSYYMTLCSLSYDGAPIIEYDSFPSFMNTYSKIKLFLSPEDEGKELGEITSLRKAIQNKWVSRAFMFQFSQSEFETYNGATVYKIEIEPGCDVYLNNATAKIKSHYSYINPNYGDSSKKYDALEFIPEPERSDETVSLDTVQVRADNENGLYCLSLISYSAYAELPTVSYDSSSYIGLNTYSKIRLSLSKEDEGKTLGEITSLRKSYQNIWLASGMLYELSKSEFDEYNGASIYCVSIEEGCEIIVGGTIRKIDKAYSFVNLDYGDESKKYEAFDFTPEQGELKNFGSIEIVNVHNRATSIDGTRWLMILLSEGIYSTNMRVDNWIDETNFLDNVLINFKENDSNQMTLRELNDGLPITVRQFGETNMIGVAIKNDLVDGEPIYAGGYMHSISFSSGTQIPSYENGESGYRTIEDKTYLINDEYGQFGEISGSYEDDGRNRKYEVWNINWHVAFVSSFIVEGIDGLRFNDIILAVGDFYSLSHFMVEGYDLRAYTASGDEVFQNIIGLSRSVTYRLVYSPAKETPKEEPASNGCAGSLAPAMAVALISLSGIAALAIARKGGKRDEK